MIDDITSQPKSLYFSMFGGHIYEVSPEEEKVLDSFQIPLKSMPNPTCKKCYGRLHIGYDIKNKHYILCPKCLKKCLSGEKILARKKNG